MSKWACWPGLLQDLGVCMSLHGTRVGGGVRFVSGGVRFVASAVCTLWYEETLFCARFMFACWPLDSGGGLLVVWERSCSPDVVL